MQRFPDCITLREGQTAPARTLGGAVHGLSAADCQRQAASAAS